MLPLLNDEMNINKFINVVLPSKRQIFSRTGAYASGVSYSSDDSVIMNRSKTESAAAFAKAVDDYVPPKSEE